MVRKTARSLRVGVAVLVGAALTAHLACVPGKHAGSTGATGGSGTGGTMSGGATGGTGAARQACDGNTQPATSPPNGFLTIDVGSDQRQYLLELPQGYDGRTPVPVMFAFHGTATTAVDFLGAAYGDVRAAAAGRFLLVAPQGLKRNDQTGWIDFNESPDNGITQADLDFFDALVARVGASYCVDSHRIFAMGHSAGGFISNYLGCVRSNVLRGIGPFAGAGPYETPVTRCGKVAAFIGHNPKEGDPDECAKVSSGTCPWIVSWPDYGWPTTQFWSSKSACQGLGSMPTEAFPGNGTTGDPLPCQAIAGCDARYPVTLCLYDYSDQWVGPHAFPNRWAARAAADFFLGLPAVE